MPPAYNAEHRIGPIKDIFCNEGKGSDFIFLKNVENQGLLVKEFSRGLKF